MIRPLNALKALLLMLARRLRRFLRLDLEKSLTLSLMPPGRLCGDTKLRQKLSRVRRSVCAAVLLWGAVPDVFGAFF
jgi:hypothetical protein